MAAVAPTGGSGGEERGKWWNGDETDGDESVSWLNGESSSFDDDCDGETLTCNSLSMSSPPSSGLRWDVKNRGTGV